MTRRSKATPKVLGVYLELCEYPVLCDEIRKRMRDEMFRRGITRVQEFEDEVREKAIASQHRERLTDPMAQEQQDVWELRLGRVRDMLTDFYFAHNLPHTLFGTIVAEVLDERNKQDLVLSFNAELAPWPLLFARAEEFEKAPEEKRKATEHHLQEIIVVLTRGMLSDQLGFVGLARKYLKIDDLKGIHRRRIGRGKVGGKAAGMCVAWRVLQTPSKDDPVEIAPRVKLPDSWFIGADVYYEVIETNGLYRFLNQKYKDLDEIRAEYEVYRPHYEQNVKLPKSVVRRLGEILDQVGPSPMIVRSSSLLEDNFGTSFAGKYETHFVPNQGDRESRVRELCAAILKVYASVLNPNALAYRKQQNLIDYDERMAILLQKVEGTSYRGLCFPQLAGVGFSQNPYRWTPQIDRSGGFLRIVWGLGTRAVDRVAGDHPRMVALSHPTLRPEKTAREIQRYSQRYIDAIDLAKNQFVTLPVESVIQHDFPGLRYIASVNEGGDLRPLHMTDPRIAPSKYVITLDGLLSNRRFVNLMRGVLRKLEQAYGRPVDIEYTVEIIPGPEPDFCVHLLQCRPQASRADGQELRVPKEVPHESIIFSSSGTVWSGKVKNIRYIVFVDPERYARVEKERDRTHIARLVGLLNRKLSGNAFIFVGPGRWGSSNPELGVPVAYADIFNADALVEVPMAIRDEEPEASFGTHFFQDLIESDIYPVAVYPGKKTDTFNFEFFRGAPNTLEEHIPDGGAYAPLVKVINVPETCEGRYAELVMDGEREEVLAYLRTKEE